MRSLVSNIATPTASLRIRVADCPGTPLLFLHGGPGGTDYLFKFFAVRVAHAGYRPVGLVQRGCPGSPSDGPFTVETSIDDFEAVRRHLGADRIAILGHSYGGFLGAAYASMHPARIERLVLICPAGARPGWRAEFDAEILRRLSPEDRAEFERLTQAAERAASPDERAELLTRRAHLSIFAYYSPHHREGKPGLANLTWRVHEELKDDAERWTSDPAWEHGLDRLTCPCAVIHGEDDVVPASVARDYGKLLPHGAVIGLPRCGHFPWMEETDAFWRDFDEAIAFGA